MFKFLKQLFGCASAEEANAEKPCCREKSRKNSAPAGRTVALDDLQNFVSYVSKALVDDPDSVTVTVENGDNDCRIIRIACRKEDTGKIIGKKGKTISAIRALVNGAAGRLQERVNVEVAD